MRNLNKILGVLFVITALIACKDGKKKDKEAVKAAEIVQSADALENSSPQEEKKTVQSEVTKSCCAKKKKCSPDCSDENCEKCAALKKKCEKDCASKKENAENHEKADEEANHEHEKEHKDQ